MLKMRENAASRAGRENPSCGKGRAPSAPRPVEGPGLITAQLIKRWSGRCLGPDGAIHPDGSHPPSVAPSHPHLIGCHSQLVLLYIFSQMPDQCFVSITLSK